MFVLMGNMLPLSESNPLTAVVILVAPAMWLLGMLPVLFRKRREC